jgi:hypothetical protein
MKTKRLTRARKEALGMKQPAKSDYEMRKSDRRTADRPPFVGDAFFEKAEKLGLDET